MEGEGIVMCRLCLNKSLIKRGLRDPALGDASQRGGQALRAAGSSTLKCQKSTSLKTLARLKRKMCKPNKIGL